MIVDAIVLTGGRSSRLDSAAKSELYLAEQTLLQHTLSAASAARCIAVVGPEPSKPLPDGVLLTRESPPFGGPVAGIAAGMAALAAFSTVASDAVLVLACDMPHVDRAIAPLLGGLAKHSLADGVVGVENGHRQSLAAAYRTGPLHLALEAHQNSGSLHGLSVKFLMQNLDLVLISLPHEATADVDTWDDAHHLGVTLTPSPHPNTIKENHE